jgi:REP-associated tyrosine transposase
VRRLAAALDCGSLLPLRDVENLRSKKLRGNLGSVMWSHAPFHFTSVDGIYIVTCGTYLKQPLYRAPEDLDLFQSQFFAVAKKHRMMLHAWCFLINHYHLVLGAASNSLEAFFRHLHSVAAIELNRRHGAAGRKVWFQYYDTLITNEKSYFARLKYVQENAVHHRVVMNAENYRWCSARWLADNASRGFVRAVREASLERVNVHDDY